MGRLARVELSEGHCSRLPEPAPRTWELRLFHSFCGTIGVEPTACSRELRFNVNNLGGDLILTFNSPPFVQANIFWGATVCDQNLPSIT